MLKYISLVFHVKSPFSQTYNGTALEEFSNLSIHTSLHLKSGQYNSYLNWTLYSVIKHQTIKVKI